MALSAKWYVATQGLESKHTRGDTEKKNTHKHRTFFIFQKESLFEGYFMWDWADSFFFG